MSDRVDDWRLSGPDEPRLIGMYHNEPCNRYPEPDEDHPRGYKPKRCSGTMRRKFHGEIVCNVCGEIA